MSESAEAVAPMPKGLSVEHTVRNMAALAALPAIWISTDLSRGLRHVGEVLASSLQSPFIYIRVTRSDGIWERIVCTRALRAATRNDDGLRDELEQVDWDGILPSTIHLAGQRKAYHVSTKDVAVRGKIRGLVAAFSPDPAFPSNYEKLVLSTGATQVALLLQRDEIDSDRVCAMEAAKSSALAASEVAARLQVALDAANLGDWSWDFYSDRIKLSSRAAEILEVRGAHECSWADIIARFAPASREQALGAMERCRAMGPDFYGEFQLLGAGDRWILGRARSAAGGDSMIGVFQDISDRKRTERTLRTTHDQFAAIINNAPVGAYLLDAGLQILQVNPTARPVFGGREPLGANLDEVLRRLWPASVAEELLARFRNTLETGEPYVGLGFTEERADRRGREYYDWQLHRVTLPDGTFGVVCYFNDISQHVLAQRALEDSEKRFRFMAESVPQKIFTARPDGAVDFLNQEWRTWIGPSDSLEWLRYVHADEQEHSRESWAAAIASGRPYQGEHRLVHSSGSERWHLTRAHAMHDDSGAVMMWIGCSTDIHDQKTAESRLERTVEERTAQLRETIEELERFSYSISHDMRAPLRAMQSFAQILEQECGDSVGSVGREYVRRIVTASERMDRLIQDVLIYSRASRSELQMENVDLAALLNGILEGYPQFQPPKAEITVSFPLPRVRANSAALTQVLSNLIDNGVKFVTPGIVPRIRIWAVSDNGRVRTHIKDNGIGIDPIVHQKIFEIFYRLSRDADGTGIGLAVARRAAERMGGNISLESEPGKGSTFCVDLAGAVWE